MRSRQQWVGTVLLAVLIGIAGVGVAAGTPAAVGSQDDTGTDDSDMAPEDCDAGINGINLQTTDDTITTDDPGRISGTVSTSNANECAAEITITFTLPDNVRIQGTSGVDTAGQGIVTGTFALEPGQSRDISAIINAAETGKHTVVADIEYFPESQPDDVQRAGGYMLTLDAEEVGDGGVLDDIPLLVFALVAVIGILLAGLLGKTVINVRSGKTVKNINNERK